MLAVFNLPECFPGAEETLFQNVSLPWRHNVPILPCALSKKALKTSCISYGM